MADIVTVYAPGHIDPYDSYGLIACRLIRHLDEMGVYVNAVAHGYSRRANQPESVRRIVERPIRPAFGGILLGYPTSYRRHGLMSATGPRVAVTMFESTKLPPGWAEVLNQLDAVVVPSRWLVEVFRNNGVEIPIHVLPLGVSETYRPARRERAAGEPFTFLAFADRGRRKGGWHALQAFLLAFGDDPAYRLILKMRDVTSRISATNANIDFVQADMDEDELYRLYLSADCLVNANMGEGFGLIPREFAATGGIVLATEWSGTADDLERWGWPVPYTLVPADWKGAKNLEPHAPLGVWAEPDVEALAGIMRAVADNREEYAARAFKRAYGLAQMYSWPAFAAGVYEVWKGAAGQQAYEMIPAGAAIGV
jgi:glycosyltransferase involved in cell wall biosynthesis